VLLHYANRLLDVARIAPDEQRLQILDRADDGPRLPFKRRLAPANEARLIGLDAHEHPVAHFGVHDARLDGRYAQRTSPSLHTLAIVADLIR
jgi:hypothetical protein